MSSFSTCIWIYICYLVFHHLGLHFLIMSKRYRDYILHKLTNPSVPPSEGTMVELMDSRQQHLES